MNELERLGFVSNTPVKTVKPFEKWQGSKLKDWEFRMKVLSVGDLIEIARATAGDNVFALLQYSTKIHTLAKAIILINGVSVITDDELKQYREDHKSPEFTAYDYALVYLKGQNEFVINNLFYAYEQIQQEYVKEVLGTDELPEALKKELESKNVPAGN